MGKPTGKKTMSVQVRMDDELRAEIKTAATELRWQDQDVIRMSLKIGLEKLRRIKYDLAGAALDAAEAAHPRITDEETLPLAADKVTRYGTGK